MRAGRPLFALLVAAALAGCASPPSPTPAPLPRPAQARGKLTGAEAAILLRDLRRERGCDGPAAAAARRYAAEWLDSVVSNPTDARRIPDARANARFRLRVAAVAARKHCPEIARQAYTEVGEIFTGAPYVGVRKQADSGLRGLPETQVAAPAASLPAATTPAPTPEEVSPPAHQAGASVDIRVQGATHAAPSDAN